MTPSVSATNLAWIWNDPEESLHLDIVIITFIWAHVLKLMWIKNPVISKSLVWCHQWTLLDLPERMVGRKLGGKGSYLRNTVNYHIKTLPWFRWKVMRPFAYPFGGKNLCVTMNNRKPNMGESKGCSNDEAFYGPIRKCKNTSPSRKLQNIRQM